jgi:hypothetical protein
MSLMVHLVNRSKYDSFGLKRVINVRLCFEFLYNSTWEYMASIYSDIKRLCCRFKYKVFISGQSLLDGGNFGFITSITFQELRQLL